MIVRYKSLTIAVAGILLFSHCSQKPAEAVTEVNTVEATKPMKLVTVGGTVSEIVCALGNCEEIVATDKTSTRPKKLQQLTSVGYRTSIRAEGIFSLQATHVLVEIGYIGEEVIMQLKDTNMPVITFQHQPTIESTKKIITEIGTAINKEKEAASLVMSLEKDLDSLALFLDNATARPTLLFVYARGLGALSICGRGTFAEELAKLAGAKFAVEELFEYKTLTPEALAAANPDYVLFFESGLESLGGIEGALQIPGLMQTTAGQKSQIIAMDGLWLSGFGPETGKAALHLAKLIHPEPTGSKVAEAK